MYLNKYCTNSFNNQYTLKQYELFIVIPNQYFELIIRKYLLNKICSLI